VFRASRARGARRNRALLLACGLAASLTALSAAADQSDDLSRLREEAAQQRRELERTEAKLRALEQKNGDPTGALPGASRTDPAAATQVSPLVQLKKSWSQVEPGTPQDRVQALLGAPDRVLRIDGALVWYYVYPEVGRGSVFFNASGKVSSRQSPSLGW
jgi:uncharacterized coiled-coil protein SlyX